jgi:hypothetical protein
MVAPRIAVEPRVGRIGPADKSFAAAPAPFAPTGENRATTSLPPVEEGASLSADIKESKE